MAGDASLQLSINDKKRYAVTGLGPWLTHSQARIGDTFKIEANGSRHLVSLERKDGVSAGPAELQRSAAQHSLAANNRASAPTPTSLGPGPQATSLPNAPAAMGTPAGGTQGAAAPRSHAQTHGGQHAEQHPGHSNAPGCAARSVGADLAPAMAPAAAPDPVARSGMARGCTTGQNRMSAAAAGHSAIPPATAVTVLQQPVQELGRTAGDYGGSGDSGPSDADARLACAPQHDSPLRPMDVSKPHPESNGRGSPTRAGGVQDEQAGHGSDDGVPLGERWVASEQLAGTGVAAGAEGRRAPVKVEATEAVAATGMVRGAPPNALPASGPGADMQRASPCPPRGGGAAVKQEPSWAGSPLGPPEARLGGTHPAGGSGIADVRASNGCQPNQGVAGCTRAGDEPPAAGRTPRPEAMDVGSGGEPLAATGALAPGLPAGGVGLAGAAGTSAGLSSKAVEGPTSAGGQSPAAGGPEGTSSGPVGSPQGQVLRLRCAGHALRLSLDDAAALWPATVRKLPLQAHRQVVLHAWGSASAPAQQGAVGQHGQELLGHAVKLSRYRKSALRITSVADVAKDAGVGVGTPVNVGLRRLACGRVVLEPWQRRQGEEQSGEEEDGDQDGDQEEVGQGEQEQEGGSRGMPEA